MIDGGMTVVYVADLEQAIDFYSGTLGLELVQRFTDNFAVLEASSQLTIGLRQASEHTPRPGSGNSISIGFHLSEPIDAAREKLEAQGVHFLGPTRGGAEAPVRIAFFKDPDGNRLYLQEFWERRSELAR